MRNIRIAVVTSFFSLVLFGCGGGSSSDENSGISTPPVVSHQVNGVAIKGPLVHADVQIFTVNNNADDFKGSLVSSGKTNESASFDKLSITEPLQDLYLIEVRSETDTIDINTGSQPILSNLYSVITKEQLLAGNTINVTPITSLAIEITANEALNEETLANSVELISNNIYLGANVEIDPFLAPALLTTDESDVNLLLQHRTILESVSVLLSYVIEGTELAIGDALTALALDLKDDEIDGFSGSLVIPFYENNPNLLNKLLEAPVRHLPILGSDKDGDDTTEDPYLLSEIPTLLLDEQLALNSNISSEDLSDGSVGFSPSTFSSDIDSDGYPDSIDAFPIDISEHLDSDLDGVGDNADAFPNNENETLDSDLDGMGDNADAFPNDATETQDSDLDGVGDNADAFPNDAAETQDSDLDGIGDNTDSYPNDAGCYLALHGNGTTCYTTWLVTQGIADIETSVDGIVFYYERTATVIVAYNIATSTYTEIALELVENEYLNVMDVSEAHNRLYLGYSTGKINYVNFDDLTLNAFSQTSEGVDGIASVGNYLLAQDDSGAWESHYIFDINGTQTDWVEWNQYSSYYKWNETLSRVYFFRDTQSPNDLLYEEIDQSSGQIVADDDTPYHGDYSISGPILLSPNDQKVLLGSGDIYNASSLEFENSIEIDFDKGVWSEAVGLSVIEQQDGEFLLTRLNDDFLIVEQKNFAGTLLAIFSQSNKAILVIQNDNKIEYVEYFANDDIDNDGVENLLDAFPEDIAASIDTDNDGAPDSWNIGYSQLDSSTSLILDYFPVDSACTSLEHAVDGVCDPTARLVFNNTTLSLFVDGILYALSSEDMRINRWDESSESYLNPIMLGTNAIWGEPISFVVDDVFGVLVGYNSGAIVRHSLDGLSRPQTFASMADAVHQLFIISGNVLAIHGSGTYYRDFQILDADANTLNTLTGGYSNDYVIGETSNRLYWFSNSSYDYINSYILDEFGQTSFNISVLYNDNPTSFMTVSDDESLIVTGGQILIKDYLTVSELARPVDLNASSELIDFVWLSNVAVGLYSNEDNHYLAFYSNDLDFTYSAIESEHQVVSMFAAEDNIVAVVNEQGSFNVVSIGVGDDKDQDQLPYWWEVSHNLDDTDATDANVDSDEDNLSNLQEFQASTNPLLADTDGDGLNDGREVLELILNPLTADTDGDFLPDLWEVENGLDGNEASDAQLDSDNDGVLNYHEYLSGTDPQNSVSVPEAVVSSLFSFEDSILPDEWDVSGDTTFTSTYSYEGDISLTINDDVTIKWERLFADVEVNFHLYSDCYSYYDKSYELYIDGQLDSSGYIEQVEWSTLSVLLQAGFKDVSLVINSDNSSCNIYIDAINTAPMQSVYEMGSNVVSKYDDTLNFYTYDGAIAREVSIPRVLDSASYARDIAVLDDGRVAVYNGVTQPVLSIYTPSEHKWESITAPAWSTVNYSSYGGIDSIGSRVFVTNMSTSGNTTAGIVQFDLEDNSVSYIDGTDLIDITVGFDDSVYGLTDSTVYKYDADTLEVIDTISIDSARSIAVDADGNIYTANWDAKVNKYQQDGTLIKTLEASYYLYDIALRENGAILLSDSSGDVYQTDVNLTSVEQLSTMSAEFLDFVPDVDFDADGLPNWWEQAFGLDMDDSSDALLDLDGDGLIALTEYEIGTLENNEDTDSDGLTDGYEFNTFGSDPSVSDSDNDDLLDGQEDELGTDPNSSDSDEDALSDYEEVMVYYSDPLASDTDQDGMGDAYEAAFGLDIIVDDANSDLDVDGLTNIEEHDAGSDPDLFDTDGDTLSDYDEVITYLTSPILIDTDSDKIPDQWELQYSFDPLSADNASLDDDADLFSALEEYYGDSDPTDSADYPMPITWSTNQGNAQHTGYTPHILDFSNFNFKWEIYLPWENLHPVTATESMVFVSSDGYYGSQGIVGVNATTGDIVWQLDYDDIHSINAPAYDDESVFFQTGGHGDSYIRSVDAFTGELEFESSYGNQWSRYLAPTIYASNVYMAGGYYGGTYGFNGNTGEQLWFNDGPQYDQFTPAVDEDYVYSFTTQLDILDRNSGELINSIDFSDFNWAGYGVGVSTVLTHSNNVVVTQQGTLVVFDVEQLDIKWQKVNAGFGSQVSVANGYIYAIANNSLYAIDEETGETKWIEDSYEYETNIIITKTHLIVGDFSTTFAINLDTGEEDWSYSASGFLTLSEDGTLYISGLSLLAISLK